MILASAHMGEGRIPTSMSVHAAQLNLPEMPPQFKPDQGILKPRRQSESSPPFDQNKNSLLFPHTSKERHSIPPVPHPPRSLGNTMQPFSTPWLNEVVRMNPMRSLEPPRLGFGSTSEFFPHFHGLSPRAPLYPPPFLSHQPYLRDYGHPSRQNYRNLHSMDIPRDSPPVGASIGLRPMSSHHQAPSLSAVNYPETRNPRYPLDFRDNKTRNRNLDTLRSPTDAFLEDSSHKRSRSNFPFPPLPSSNTIGSSQGPYSSSKATSKSSESRTAKSKRLSPQVSQRKMTVKEDSPERPASPFHPHFQKGSLVTLVNGTRKVEELLTKDFVNAAEDSPDLTLDPSRILSISSSSNRFVSTITFSFASTNTEIPVEASNSHPFFVFHRGWSSCSPERTLKKYGLDVYQLRVGDVCVSLKKLEPNTDSPEEQSTSMPPPRTPLKALRSPPESSSATSDTVSTQQTPRSSPPSSPPTKNGSNKRSSETDDKEDSSEKPSKKLKVDDSIQSRHFPVVTKEPGKEKRKRRWSE